MTDVRTLLLSDHEKDHARGDCGCPCLWMAAEADTLRQRVAALEGLVAFEVIPALKVFAGDNRGVRSLVKRLEALNPTPDR